MLNNKRSGFTLIELLVVIAIMGVLSSIMITAIGRARSNARDTQRIAQIDQVRKAVEMYYLNHNEYPNINDPVDFQNGWGLLISNLRSDGVLAISENKELFAKSTNFIADVIYPKVFAAETCPSVVSPQDPLFECKVPNEIISGSVENTYSYMASRNQGWQYYRIRTKMENNNHAVLRMGVSGDFAEVGDGGCNSAAGYYCVGSSGYVPDLCVPAQGQPSCPDP